MAKSSVADLKPSALITGASKGIGRAIAVKLATMGYNVGLLARNTKDLQQTASLCEKANPNCQTLILTCDLSNMDQLNKSLELCCNNFGPLYVVINNAGLGGSQHIESGNIQHWTNMLDVNLRAVMQITHYCVPYLKQSIQIQRQEETRYNNNNRKMKTLGIGIINVGSVAGRLYKIKSSKSAYIASKFGILGFTHGIFEDIRKYGIKVSCLMPGYVNTEMVQNIQLLKDTMHFDKMMDVQDCAFAVEYILKCSNKCCPVQIFLESQEIPNKTISKL